MPPSAPARASARPHGSPGPPDDDAEGAAGRGGAERLARTACRVLGGSFALVHLAGATRRVEPGASVVEEPASAETALDAEIIRRTLASGEPLVVTDAGRDLTGGVAAVLGVAVWSTAGEALGALVVCDARPRRWTADDVAVLGDLAAAIGARSDRPAEALALAADRLQVALDAADLGAWSYDAADGVYRWDARCQALLGVAPQTTPDMPVPNLHPDDRPLLLAMRDAAMAPPGAPEHIPLWDVEYRLAVGGTTRWIRSIGRSYPGEGSAHTRLAGVVLDATVSRQAYVALRLSRRLQLALLAARVGTFEFATATGEQTGDRRARAILGLADDEPLSAFAERVHPADRDAFDRFTAEAALGTDRPVEIEYRLAAPGGAVRWIAATAWGRADGDGVVCVVGTVRDVSVQREREAALTLRKQRQGLLLRLLQRHRAAARPDAVLRDTAATLGRHLGAHRVGTWTMADDDTLDLGVCWSDGTLPPLAGLVPSATLGAGAVAEARAGRTFAVADTRASPHAAGAALADAGVRAVIGAPILRGGRWVGGFYVHACDVRAWTDAEVALVRDAAEQAWDAVERTRAAAGLRASEARFRTLAEALPVVVYTSGPDGRVDYLNRRWFDYTGQPHTVDLARAGEAATHPDDAPAVEAAWHAARRDHTPMQAEVRLRRHDGAYRWFATRAVPVEDAAGAVVRWFGTSTDIHAAKATEAELSDRVAERTADLARSNAELDRFAYVASHDLKAPLRAIDSLAAWVQEDAGDRLPDESARHLALLRARVVRMEGLLDGLLAYSRAARAEAESEAVDTAALVREAVGLVAPARGAAVVAAGDAAPAAGITVVLDGDFPTVVSARAPLELVVRNLIGNAIKHHDRPDGRVVVSARTDGPWAVFSVSDDGPGIAPEYHGRVFDLFQTLRPRDDVEGSGMGLSIVRKTVESRGGAVEIYSVGRGSTFVFTWPLSSTP